MAVLESIISYFNPVQGLKRAQANKALSLTKSRTYSATSRNSRNSFAFLRNGGAVNEAGQSFRQLAIIGNELTQNNPLASRISTVWANNAVGSGIKAEISEVSGKTDLTNKITADFGKFCKSPSVGVSGNKTLYKIQNEIMHELVTSGGVFVCRQITRAGDLAIQLIEQSRLSEQSSPKKSSNTVVNGIEFTKNGEVFGYWFDPPEHSVSMVSATFLPVKDVHHVFSANKGNQHLGISWFAGVALTLDRYATLNEAKIMQQQVSACFSLIIEEPNDHLGIGDDDRIDELEPALISYVKAGSNPHVINPPKADNAQNFEKSIKADIAIGVGLTYEMLTGDYSQTNFASGRMSRSEFNTGLISIQSNILEPMLNKIFNWYMELYQVRNDVKANAFTADWAFPTTQAVNPVEEHDLLMSKVRHGMLSPSKACKLGGENFDNVMEQWVSDKTKFGELPFDIDPSKYARTGNQLNTDDASSSNFDNESSSNSEDNSKDKKNDNEKTSDNKE